MKMSTFFMWVLYGVVSSVVMTMLDIHFDWGLFTWLD